jgi:flagellar biosynthetic protein FliR
MITTLETAWVLTLLLAACRVAGVVLLAPPMGHAVVPVRLRLMLAGVMALAVVGRLSSPVEISGLWNLAVLAGVELLIGGTIGYAARLIFVGVQLGATHIAQQIGIGLADALNPGVADASGPIRRLFDIVAVVVFVAIGGHLAVTGALMKTFDTFPLGGGAFDSAGVLQAVVGLLGASFLLAIRVAGPVLAAMIITTVAMGMLQRAVPQCNVLSVGLPIRAMLGLLILAGALMLLGPLVDSARQAMFHTLGGVWEGAR